MGKSIDLSRRVMRRAMRRAMRRILFALFLLCAASGFAAGPGQRPRLALFVLSNETGNSVYDAVCASARRSLALTLHQIGAYDLQNVPREIGAGDAELAAAALEQRADYVMFGGVAAAKGKALVFRIGLYDRAKGTVTVRRESPAVASLDLFEAVDTVILEALTGITGGHLGFGRVELASAGEKGAYRVLLDGMEAGEDLTEIERVLAGAHTITIMQRRMLGETEIGRSSFELAEGAVQRLSFSVPYLTAAEKDLLDGMEREIREKRERPAALAEVEGKTNQLASLLHDVSYSPRLAEYRSRSRQLQAEWALLKNRFLIEDRAWEPDSLLLDPSIVVYLTADQNPDPAALRRKVEENAVLLATLMELSAGRAMAAGDHAEGTARVESILDFSRYLPAERKTEYARAIATLRDIAAYRESDPQKYQRDLVRVFGAQIAAGKKLAAIRDAAARTGSAVVISTDSSTAFAVGEKAADAPGPILVPSKGAPVALRAVHEDREGILEIVVAEGRKIAFVDEGFQAFGRAALSEAVANSPLRIRSIPDGYSVYVNDVKVGVTPLGQVMVPEGPATVSCEKEGAPTIELKTVAVPGRLTTVSLGQSASKPLPLPRRSIAFRGSADEWAGMDPIIEGNFEGRNFLGNPDYAVRRVYACQDARYLYWRVEFAKTNPLWERSPEMGAGLYVQFQIDGYKKNMRANLMCGKHPWRPEGDLGWIGIQNTATRKGSWTAEDMLTLKSTQDAVTVRAPLSWVSKYMNGVLPVRVYVSHQLRKQGDWEQGSIETSICYIDFSKKD